VGNRVFARFGALCFGLQFVWGAVLAVSLQARSVTLSPQNGLRAYALIAALGALVGMLTQLFSGPLADRYLVRFGNRRLFYAIGVGIAGPALLWFYLAPSYGQLLLAFFSLEFGMNIVSGPYAAIVPDYVPQRQTGAASSWMGILQSVGNAGGLLVAGFVGNLFLVAGVLVVVLGISWCVSVHATQRPKLQVALRQPFFVGQAFRTLLVSRFAINVGFYTLLGFLFFFVSESLGTAVRDIRLHTALLFLAFTLANVLGAGLAARPTDMFDKRAVVLVANGVVAIGLVLLLFSPSLMVAVVAATIAGVGWGAYFVADWSLACVILPRGAMASAMSVWNIAATLPQILAPLLTLPLVERCNLLLPGSGPRMAIGLVVLEFTFGALWLYRLPLSVVKPMAFGEKKEQTKKPQAVAASGF